MKNTLFLAVISAIVLCSSIAYSKPNDTLKTKKHSDSVKIYIADEVFVRSTRASSKSAMSYKSIEKEDIEKQNLAQDIPFVINQTPNTIATSDAGNGVGYTGIRIRGSDGARTAISINGIPVNDAESQQSYLVNLPDLLSSADNIQVQRGVGVSTNGVGAFGANVNIQTSTLNPEPYASMATSGGSFGTLKNTLQLGSGLIGKFSFDARLSNINSQGYVDRGASDLGSYFLAAGYHTDNTLIKINAFSGKEKTYQSWNGVPEAKLFGSEQDLINHYNRNTGYPGALYNNPADAQNLFSANNRTYNYFLYENQTDNYKMDNYQLFVNHQINSDWNATLATYYTAGKGYYEEYRYQDDLSIYNLSSASGYGNVVRRKQMINDNIGTVYSLIYSPDNDLEVTFGGGYSSYRGNHFGNVITLEGDESINPDDRYYDNDALKNDFNSYIKTTYTINDISLFVDLQYRRVYYSYFGYNDQLQNIQQSDLLHFFNPKLGLTYSLDDQNNIYTSFAHTGKEASRNEYIYSTTSSRPSPEYLNDLELGYKHQSEKTAFSLNGYYMGYKDQLVLTGEINDIGEYVRTNVENSYRAGVEFDITRKLNDKFLVNANVSWSVNKIKEFTEYVDNYDTGTQDINTYKNTDISYSPDWIAGLGVTYSPIKNLNVGLNGKYVGQQYLDNTSSEEKSIDAFFVADLVADYKIDSFKHFDLTFNLLVNNLFNTEYESNGYTWGYISGGEQIIENYYFPQSGINVLVGLKISTK